MLEEKIKEVLVPLEQSRNRWCAEEVDDTEEMCNEIPSLLEYSVRALREALGMPVFEILEAQYGTDDVFIEISDKIEIYENSKSVKLKCCVKNSSLGCDPVPGVKKRLKLVFNYGEIVRTQFFDEGNNVVHVFLKE